MASNDKLVSAKVAARLFADVKQKFDMLGVVSFSNDADEEFPLTVVPDQDDAAGVRGNAQAAINGISDDARTSIGDGLQKGQDMLSGGGNPDHQWAMVLLSDGMENEPLSWFNVRPGIVSAGTKVHAIALGQDADEEMMRDIAESTCGAVWVDQCYHYIEESGVLAAARANAPAISQLPNALSDIYRRAEETIADHQRLWQSAGILDGSQTVDVQIAEDGVRNGFFSINWNDAATPLNVNVTGPSGVTLIKLSDSQTHVVFYADKLPPGTYHVELSSTSGANTWVGSLSGRIIHGTSMYTFLDNVLLERRPGLPVRLQASLTDDKGPVSGAVISATVRRPDGTADLVHLVDDGGPYDDIADDGVYGYVYDRINRPLVIDVLRGHTWIFDLHAKGVNNDGNSFERHKRLTYTPYLGREQTSLDQEPDGMLDRWEDRFDGVDSTVVDGDQDPDNDGLSSKEEFEFGTNPDDPDTDRGGETDGSEVAKGQNPLFSADDTIPPIADFWAENKPESVILHFNPRPEYKKMRIYRRDGLVGPFALIDVVDLPMMTDTLRYAPAHDPEFDPTKGQLLDKDLVNDQDYFYIIQPEGESNALGRPSQVLYAEPAKDPVQPEGTVIINDDDRFTASTSVTLTLYALTLPDGTQNAKHVQVSNAPDLAGAPWLPFKSEMPWSIDPDPETDLASVYVRFRDGAGNVSDVIYGDSILYKPPIVLPPGLLDFGWVFADFSDPGFGGFTIIYTELNFGDLGLGGASSSALSAAQDGGPLYYGGRSFDLEVRDASGAPVTQFNQPFSLTVRYEDWQWKSGGIATEESLNLFWDTGQGWEPVLPCDGCSHDRVNNVIVAQLDHLTKFALLGDPFAQLYLPVMGKGF
jgi:hypothetical protein